MRQRTRKMIVCAALAAALLWGAFNYPFQRRNKQTEREPIVSGEVTAAVESVLVTGSIPVERMTRTAWGSDPFRPISVQAVISENSTGWRLTGILYRSEAPLAIINNKRVRLGDVVDEARVVNITQRTVTLDYQGASVELTVTKG